MFPSTAAFRHESDAMTTAPSCPRCGKPSEPGDVFCAHCGGAVSGASAGEPRIDVHDDAGGASPWRAVLARLEVVTQGRFAIEREYRADLRELNELNFARFDSKVEQRLAELHAKLDAKIDRVTAQLDTRIDRLGLLLDAKMDRAEAERLFAALDAKIDRVAVESAARLDAAVADLHAVLERRLGEQTRWLFVAWASLLISIMGLWLRG